MSGDGRLYQALLKLGYRKQVQTFRKFVQGFPVSAFLIHGGHGLWAFPEGDRLVEIMRSFFPTANPALVTQAVARFLALRGEMQRDKGAGKKVSTSELIDWFRVLGRYPEEEAFARLEGKLPFAGVLLKSWEDHLRYLKS